MILQGKHVLITGAAKRTGAVIARTLAAAGCRVIVHCHRDLPEAGKFAAALPGGGHRAVCADLAIPEEVETLIREVGACELLVNSAAIFHRPGSAEDLAAQSDYRQINFLAPQRLLESFFEQDIPEGAAVNITDAFALLPGEGAYWQSKRDLTELTWKLAPLWAERGFRINAVAPGPMTPPPWAPESRMEKILQRVPLRRAVREEDLAETVKFLLASDSISGSVVPVDCGVTAAAFSNR